MKKLFILTAIFFSITAIGQTAQDYYKKGSDEANSKDFAGSIKDFDKAIKLDKDYTDAYYNRGTSKLYMKDYKGAITDYDKAIALRPGFAHAFTNRGVAKLQFNDIKGAIVDFDSTIKLDGNNTSAFFMRGQAKLQLQDMDGGCSDLTKAKELGDTRAETYIKQYCGSQTASANGSKANESLAIDWPDAEGWKVANQQENSEQKMIELLRNNETFDNWTEIGTMFVYKGVSASKKIPLTNTVNVLYNGAKKNCPSAKLTVIDKDEAAKYPWIIFKIECSLSGTESQVWYAIQGTDELFVNFRAVKQATIPRALQDKWVKFFKSAKIVTQ